MYRILITLSCITTTMLSHAQELAYRQLTVKDGLPGSIVYHCIQDRKGFIWFATNQGVSRFDGRNFHTFTKDNGLPDNDILQLYLDKYDDVWFISFPGIPSVIYHDSIIRFNNCPATNAICEDPRTDSILLISQGRSSDSAGYYQSANRCGRWTFTSHLRPSAYYTQRPILRAAAPGKTNFYFATEKTPDESSILVQNGRTSTRFPFKVHHWQDNEPFTRQLFFSLLPDGQSLVFLTYDSAYYADSSHLAPLISLQSLGLNLGNNNYVNCVYAEDDTTLWLCVRNKGLLRLRNFNSSRCTIKRFFPGSDCTNIMKDREGGYWVTTFSDGVFYLPNLSFGVLNGPPDLSVSSVRSLHTLDSNRLVAGFDDGNIMVFDRDTWRWRLFPHWAARNKNNRIMDVRPYLHNSLIAAADMGLHRIFPADTSTRLSGDAIKELYIRPDHTIAVGASASLSILDSMGRITNSIQLDRATCVAGIGDDCYWGTHHGVYALLNNHRIDLGQSIPALSGVINHIDISPDSTLWVSTEDGIVIWRPGHFPTRIGKSHNLASNLCKQTSFDGNTAWVATDNGISRIDYHWQDTAFRCSISNITEEDGLRSNDVNRTVAADGYIWAATARGICFFPATYTSRSTTPPGIVVTRILA